MCSLCVLYSILATSFPVIQDTRTLHREKHTLKHNLQRASPRPPATICFQAPSNHRHMQASGCAGHMSWHPSSTQHASSEHKHTHLNTNLRINSLYFLSLPTFSASSASCLMTGISPDSPFWHLMNASLNLLAFSGFAKRKANNSFCCSTLPVSGSSLQSGVK
jgi:hypothetical protein